MNIVTLGGGFIADHLPYPKITTRISEPQDLYDAMGHVSLLGKPDVLVNCIGKTGRPNVDWCETHRAETYQSNVLMPLMIAKWCQDNNVHMIHIGSGCIYFGESPNLHYVQADGSPMPDIKTYSLGDPNYQPWWPQAFTVKYPTIKIDDGWKETDFANPQSYYSKTKYACDLALDGMENVTILRIRMPISEKNNPRNLINKLRGYERIINIPNSMTFMKDLVRCVDWVSKGHHTGVWHVANPQPLTAVQIIKEYQKYVSEHKFDIIYSEQDLDKLTVAKRSNCILSTQKLANAGFTMTPSEEALAECMHAYTQKN